MARIMSGGMISDGLTPHDVMIRLAQQHAHMRVASLTALTDNSGGDADQEVQPLQVPDAVAAVGNSLAQVTDVTASVGNVRDAISELIDDISDSRVALGMSALTDNTGGTAADGTIGAIDDTITGAATGVTVAGWRPVAAKLNRDFNALVALANGLARAVGVAVAPVGVDAFGDTDGDPNSASVTTFAATSTGLGAGASPGITSAAMQVELNRAAGNVRAIADVLKAVRTAATPLVSVE